MNWYEDEYPCSQISTIKTVDDARQWLKYEGWFMFLFNSNLYAMDTDCYDCDKKARIYTFSKKSKDGKSEEYICEKYSMDELWNAPIFDGKTFLDIFPELKFYF